MLGTFLKHFSQAATSQVATSLMCNFLRGNFPSLSFTQRQVRQPFLTAALGPQTHPSRSARSLCSLRRLRKPNISFGKLLLGKMYIWEVATLEIVTWEVALGKMPLEKYLTTSIIQKIKVITFDLSICKDIFTHKNIHTYINGVMRMSFCHKLNCSNPYIFFHRQFTPLIFQTLIL